MSPIRRHLRRFLGLALFAMLGLALAPSVSRLADAQAAANPFAQVCSAAQGGDTSGAAGDSAMRLEHCGLCCVAAAPMLMPPAPVTQLPAPAGAAHVAARFLDASHTLFAWAPAQARAPPVFS